MSDIKLNLLLEEIIQKQILEFVANDVRFQKANHDFEILRGDYLEDFIQDLVQRLYSFGYLKIGTKTQEKDIESVKTEINKMVQRILTQIEVAIEYEFKKSNKSSLN
jgi:hypothetical protein